MNFAPVFYEKGTINKTSILQEKHKTNFSETFFFIAKEQFELSNYIIIIVICEIVHCNKEESFLKMCFLLLP
jgi:hypothetical protein